MGDTEYNSVKQFCYLGDMISAWEVYRLVQLSASGAAKKNQKISTIANMKCVHLPI